MNNVIFTICTENGYLEKQSILLCKSIRKFGGNLANCDIFSFQPRKETEIAKDTLTQFNNMNVNHISENLNSEYEHYPYANKIFACEYLEARFPSSTIVFLDSDKLILNDPVDIGSLDYKVGIRPVEYKGVAFENAKDENYTYWNAIEKKYDFEFDDSQVNTTISNTLINPYWNAGLIASDARIGLYTSWKNVFLSLMEHKMIPNQGIKFMDQIALSVAIQLDAKDKLFILDDRYNRSCYTRDMITNIPNNTITLHYHRLFKNNGVRSLFKLSQLDRQKALWIDKKLAKTGIYPHGFLGKLKSNFI